MLQYACSNDSWVHKYTRFALVIVVAYSLCNSLNYKKERSLTPVGLYWESPCVEVEIYPKILVPGKHKKARYITDCLYIYIYIFINFYDLTPWNHKFSWDPTQNSWDWWDISWDLARFSRGFFFTSTRGGYTTDIQLSPYYIIFHKSFDQVREIVNFAPLIVDDLAF